MGADGGIAGGTVAPVRTGVREPERAVTRATRHELAAALARRRNGHRDGVVVDARSQFHYPGLLAHPTEISGRRNDGA